MLSRIDAQNRRRALTTGKTARANSMMNLARWFLESAPLLRGRSLTSGRCRLPVQVSSTRKGRMAEQIASGPGLGRCLKQEKPGAGSSAPGFSRVYGLVQVNEPVARAAHNDDGRNGPQQQ
jgi:hypothetical protein